jgi:DNA-binding response OmpR family regulator
VGPVTAAAALEEGFPEVMTATRARLGSLVACLGDYLCTKGRTLDLAGVRVRVQGSLLDLDGREVRLTPRERTLLDAMLDSRGAVVSKRSLSRLAWDSVVSEHTVEVTVNRLRRKLGPAALALETTNRRGYRLAVAVA